MKLTTIFAAAAASALLAAAPFAVQAQNNSDSTQKPAKGGEASRDVKHLKDLAVANMSEVEAGKLALEKAQDQKVKDFAQHMVDDHGKMLDEVKSLAQSKGVDLPSAPDAKHEKAMKRLQSASAADFDREYMREMVKSHRDALKLVQRTAKDAKDADLKAAAQKAVPDIQQHLKMAQDLSKTEKKSASGASGQPGGQSSQAGAAR